MKIKPNKRATYEAPKINVIGMGVEGILCASPDWYKKGGEGDFSFSYENDNTWA